MPNTLRDTDVTTPKTMNAYNSYGTRPKQKTIIMLPPQEQPGTQMKHKWHSYHVPFGDLVIHELPSKWNKNKEVLHHLKHNGTPPPQSNIRNFPRLMTWWMPPPTLLTPFLHRRKSNPRLFNSYISIVMYCKKTVPWLNINGETV